MSKILVVEDAVSIATLLVDHLSQRGHETLAARDGSDALAKLGTGSFDLVVLDLMLPGVSGLDVCRSIRRSVEPQPIVLMLTALVGEEDVVLGFEVGADDYVCKPFRVNELMARVDALLRLAGRARGRSEAGRGPSVLVFGQLEIDLTQRRVTVDGQIVRLTPMELDLLGQLARASGQLKPRAELLREVWGYQHDGYARTVDTHVTRVRKKLAAAGLAVDPIATVHGRGYRFDGGER